MKSSRLGSEPIILNFILLGTGENEGERKTVLTALANSIEIGPYQSVHLINGPGGVSKDKSNHDLMLGTYDFTCTYHAATGEIIASKIKKTRLKGATKLGGLVFGSGCEDVYKTEAIAIIEAILKQRKEPLVINMYGFSRGADTMVRISNVINALYAAKNIKLNLFSIDPVPGPGRQNDILSRQIPAIVGEFCCVGMQDERRVLFKLQDKSQMVVQDPQKTKVHYYIYRGNHSYPEWLRYSENTPKGTITSVDHIKNADVIKLTYDLIQQFAARNGTKFKNNMPIPFVLKLEHGYQYLPSNAICTRFTSDEERLNAYTRMVLNQKIHAKTSSHTALISDDRDFVKRKRDYFLHGTNIFQDRTHMLLFNKCYPYFFDYFFQNRIKNSPDEFILSDIAQIKKNPELTQFLENNEFPIRDLNKLLLKKPSGIFLVADDFYDEDSELLKLWEAAQAAVFPSIAGYHQAISKNNAEEFLNNIYAILISDKSDNYKINEIKEFISATIIQYQATKLFIKLAPIVQGHGLNFAKALLNYFKYFSNQEDPNDAELAERILKLNVNLMEMQTNTSIPDETKQQLVLANIQALSFYIRDRFPKKYTHIIAYLNTFLTDQKPHTVVANVLAELKNQISESNDHSPYTESRNIIIAHTKTFLQAIAALGGENDSQAIRTILSIANSALINLAGQYKMKNPLNALFHKLIFGTASLTNSEYDNKPLVDIEIEKFRKVTDELFQPPTLIYSDGSESLEGSQNPFIISTCATPAALSMHRIFSKKTVKREQDEQSITDIELSSIPSPSNTSPSPSSSRNPGSK